MVLWVDVPREGEEEGTQEISLEVLVEHDKYGPAVKSKFYGWESRWCKWTPRFIYDLLVEFLTRYEGIRPIGLLPVEIGVAAYPGRQPLYIYPLSMYYHGYKTYIYDLTIYIWELMRGGKRGLTPPGFYYRYSGWTEVKIKGGDEAGIVTAENAPGLWGWEEYVEIHGALVPSWQERARKAKKIMIGPHDMESISTIVPTQLSSLI
mgnify:CR=1 FL=1